MFQKIYDSNETIEEIYRQRRLWVSALSMSISTRRNILHFLNHYDDIVGKSGGEVVQ